jgi:hypothetical protein
MPRPLFALAPMTPATWVPCQELSDSPQFSKAPPFSPFSAAVTQSPGSEESLSRPPPSLATSRSAMKSRPCSNWPPVRSGWSRKVPLSSTATTTLLRPLTWSQACWKLVADCSVASGVRRYH